jgi:hypothetical protein
MGWSKLFSWLCQFRDIICWTYNISRNRPCHENTMRLHRDTNKISINQKKINLSWNNIIIEPCRYFISRHLGGIHIMEAVHSECYSLNNIIMFIRWMLLFNDDGNDSLMIVFRCTYSSILKLLFRLLLIQERKVYFQTKINSKSILRFTSTT